MKKKIKDKNHKSSPNLKSSSSSFSCSAPSSFQFGSLLFSLHLVAPDEFLMLHNHPGQTFCFQKSPVPVAPPRNQSHISFFLSKTQKILNEIYGQIWHCYHSSSTDSKDVGTMTPNLFCLSPNICWADKSSGKWNPRWYLFWPSNSNNNNDNSN